jgi:Zn-dependent M28 family amino/carboxypeptidase
MVTTRSTGSTDHIAFDEVGIPGFQFIQDPMDYFSRTHHSDLDTYDRLQKADLMQASAIIASFVYATAMSEQKIVRKPLPPAKPKPIEKAAVGMTPAVK